MLDGEPTGKMEVSGYRDLGRVKTNKSRGGMCLVLAEGIALKAPKIERYTSQLKGIEWPWLNDLIEGKFSEVNATVQKGLAAAEDIFDLFDQITERDNGTEMLKFVKGQVEFREVSFSYDNDLPQVLRALSFTVKPGEIIALVGRS